MAKRTKQELRKDEQGENIEQKKVSDALQKMAADEAGKESQYVQKFSQEELKRRYEEARKMQESFEETCAVPLETLVDGINLSGLIRNPDYKFYESHDYDEVVAWDEKEGLSASTEYVDLLLRDMHNVAGAGVKGFMGDMSGTILLDLGSGPSNGYFLAKACGAKGYIGVDKSHNHNPKITNQEESNFNVWASKELRDKINIPYAIVQEGILDFLKRLPDNSVSILTTGVEAGVGDRFARVVEKEIERVLDPKGAYITFFSKFEPKGLKKDKYQGISNANRHGGLWKFTKQS